jgi:hypothetical protein
MELATVHAQQSISDRTAPCLWCHQITTHADVLRHHGLCGQCVHDNHEMAWRVVYDRDRKIGRIPRNLRAAYRL